MKDFIKPPIIICCLIICSMRLPAQDITKAKAVISLKDLYTLSVPAIDISDCQIIDSTVLKISYQFTYRIAPQAPEKTSGMILNIGNRNVKFLNNDYFRRDSMYSYKLKHMIASYSCDEVPCEEVSYETTAKTISTFNRIPNGPMAFVTYDEPMPKINWLLSCETTREILGYSCFLATGTFGGRKWIVWFAQDLSVPWGPWKLNGLPGIILQAEDQTGSYKFECTQISTQPEPIYWYNCRYQRIKKHEWQRFDRATHVAPLEQTSNEREIWYYYQNKRLDNKWTIPYNPIELE